MIYDSLLPHAAIGALWLSNCACSFRFRLLFGIQKPEGPGFRNKLIGIGTCPMRAAQPARSAGWDPEAAEAEAEMAEVGFGGLGHRAQRANETN